MSFFIFLLASGWTFILCAWVSVPLATSVFSLVSTSVIVYFFCKSMKDLSSISALILEELCSFLVLIFSIWSDEVLFLVMYKYIFCWGLYYSAPTVFDNLMLEMLFFKMFFLLFLILKDPASELMLFILLGLVWYLLSLNFSFFIMSILPLLLLLFSSKDFFLSGQLGSGGLGGAGDPNGGEPWWSQAVAGWCFTDYNYDGTPRAGWVSFYKSFCDGGFPLGEQVLMVDEDGTPVMSFMGSSNYPRLWSLPLEELPLPEGWYHSHVMVSSGRYVVWLHA